MKYTNARIFENLFARRTEGWYVGEAADAGFDGGEWSGPAWADAWEREYERTLSAVAEAVGVPLHVLEHEVQCYEHEGPFTGGVQ